MTNGTNEITIISDAQTCRAIPGEFFTNPGATITFKNIGNGAVTVLFPEDSRIDPKYLYVEQGGQEQATITIESKQRLTENLIIFYDVYNNVNKTYASAELRPIIIVYPT